jgi:tetratricopeptide (TPR) repeat protein
MTAILSKSAMALCLAASLILPACVPGKKPEADRAVTKPGQTQSEQYQGEQYLRQGDFEKALETYNLAFKKYSDDPALRKSYIEAAEMIEDSALAAFEREDYATSGRIYYLLDRQYPNFQDFTGDLSFDRKYLRSRLSECSGRLSEQALAQYRQGNLPAAISLWKSILAFEPENDAAKKAVDTASTQLKSLKQKPE